MGLYHGIPTEPGPDGYRILPTHDEFWPLIIDRSGTPRGLLDPERPGHHIRCTTLEQARRVCEAHKAKQERLGLT